MIDNIKTILMKDKIELIKHRHYYVHKYGRIEDNIVVIDQIFVCEVTEKCYVLLVNKTNELIILKSDFNDYYKVIECLS
jgi:hypothetical protein